MSTVSEIVLQIGRANLRFRLGVSDTAISNALSRNKFPSKWYRVMLSECEKAGLDCPMDLFSFTEKTPEDRVA